MLGYTTAQQLRYAINAIPLINHDAFITVVAQLRPATHITPEAYQMLYDATYAFAKQVILIAARYKHVLLQNQQFKTDNTTYQAVECPKYLAINDRVWAHFRVSQSWLQDARGRRCRYFTPFYYNINFRLDDVPIRLMSLTSRMSMFHANIIQQVLQRKNIVYDKTLFNSKINPLTNIWLHLFARQCHYKQIMDYYDNMAVTGRRVDGNAVYAYPSRDIGSSELAGYVFCHIVDRLKAIIGQVDIQIMCE